MKRIATILFLTGSIFFGCASSYNFGDFNEVQLFEDTFKVTYIGGRELTDEKGADLTLLRCAEIAQKNGFTYFAVISEENSADTSAQSTTSRKSSSYGLAKPGLTNTIRCFKGIQIGPLYDVNVIIPSLRKKHGL
jgi:hypothetical protein